MTSNLQDLIKQWNRLSDTAIKSGQEYAEMDSLHWFNYLAFDIIGDLVSTKIKTAAQSYLFSISGIRGTIWDVEKGKRYCRSSEDAW